MNLRNISAWSIRNPIIPIVFFIGVMIAGLVSFSRMDVNNMPDIQFPGVLVNVSQPGAAPTEIETQVTQKVEGAARSVPGVEEIQSTAAEGNSRTIVLFTVGTDPDVATNQVKNAVDQIRSDLPQGILEPQVTKLEANDEPLAYFAVSADDMTMEQLSWFVDDTISKSLLSVEGMASVSRNGGVDREIRVVVDPERMQALGVTASDVNNALRQVNVDAAGGQAEIAGSRQSVRVLGNAGNAYQLSQTRINLGNGREVRLSDIAKVYDGYSEKTRIAKLHGREVVTFNFQRALGASDVAVYDAAMKKLKTIEKANPNIHITQLFAPVDYTKGQYGSSMEALVEGAVLAIVIVYLFLRDWRATFISAIAIPLSAIPTFWFMDLLGFTLNSLSLLALSLVAGVLVDDAIVEIENIVRHMRMGKSAYQASIDAADEIGLAVVATTFSIVAVFLPVGLMPGIPGEFFKAFGLTVVAAVLMSLAVARLITPMVAAYFLKAHGHAEHGGGKAMDLYVKILAWTLDSSEAHRRKAALVPAPALWWYYLIATVLIVVILAVGMGTAYLAFEALHAGLAALGLSKEKTAFVLAATLAPISIPAVILVLGKAFKAGASLFEHFGDWYRYLSDRILARMHDHRFYAFCGGLYALVVTFALLWGLPQQFQPSTNHDTSQVNIEMVPGTTLEQTSLVADRVTHMLEKEPDVERVLEDSDEGKASLFIALKPAHERHETSIEFERRLAPQLQQIPDARVSFATQSGGFGTGRDISVMLSGNDSKLLNKTAQTLVQQMRSIPGVVAPRIAADLQRPELVIVPRFDLAAQLGVTTQALSQTIRIATLGEIDQNAAKFSLSDRQVPIRVMLGRSSRRDFSTIENLAVPTTGGGSVPLNRVAEIRFGAGPTQIQRYNQSRRVFVGADLGEGQVKGPVMDAIQNLPIMKHLPAGVSNAPVGEDKWQEQMINEFAVAVVSGIFLVFAVLVLLYKRFVSPLVNMASLLLAPLGGLLALTLVGQPISMPVYIGLLMLLGIVAKNSILLIDFAIEEMAKGVDKVHAIIDAGHKRAQPIIMTTVAMTAGMVPTAISLSGDGAFRAPMGLTVIGGLLLSTMLTLVIVPAAFSLADGFEKRIGPRLRKAVLTFEPHHADEAHRGRHGGEAFPAE